MRTIPLALLRGDGIGGEVIEAAALVLESAAHRAGTFAFDFRDYPIGKEAFRSTGKALPDATLAGIREARVALLGALGASADYPSPVGQLRKKLELYADLRPVKSWPGVWSLKPGIDILCIRECTEGFLADRNLYSGNGEFMPDADTVISLRVLTRAACERIAEFAFETARKEGRRKITVVHKANVLKLGCGFFLGVVRETAARYPEIEVADEYVDNVANTLISAPESYDILLATNLFGDIISDEAAALVSNLVPSANSGPDCAVFAPVNHEGREEEAGKGIANPLAHILCASMLLRHLGENGAAEAVESAVSAVLSGGMLPLELGGNCGTAEMSGAICAALAAGQGR